MNSNWKLLSAGLLVAALAGCGGGGSGEMTEPTAEEKCTADGGIYEDGTCKSADDLRNEGAQEEGDRRDQEDADKQDAADAEAARKAAMTLRTVLAATITDIADTSTQSFTKPTDFASKDGSARETTRVVGRAYEVVYATAPDLTAADANDRIEGSAFSTSGTITHKSNGLSSGGAAQFTTAGSYHGVMGTYTCVPSGANTCTSNVNSAGNLVLAGGAWSFKPTNPSQMVSTADGVEWGWWVDKTDGSISAAGVFYGAGTTEANTAFAEGGKATYSGSAVGKYSVHRGAGADNDAGHFTADASLSVNFGASPTISGMIDGFVGADGQSRDWMVELKEQAHASGVWGTTRSDPAEMTVWTMNGDKADAAGEWSGAFYGGSATATPTAAAGAFDAMHGNIGNMVGAFGAEKD